MKVSSIGPRMGLLQVCQVDVQPRQISEEKESGKDFKYEMCQMSRCLGTGIFLTS